MKWVFLEGVPVVFYLLREFPDAAAAVQADAPSSYYFVD
jgi:hypothetical protein